MNYVYSANNNMFYPQEYRKQYEANNDWPVDGIDVTDAVFLEFTSKPPVGKIRIVGDDGLPAWGDIPPPSPEDLIAGAEAEKQKRIDSANDYMNSKQWPGKAAIGRLKGDELIQYNLWLDYLDALEVINTSSAPDIDWPIQPEK